MREPWWCKVHTGTARSLPCSGAFQGSCCPGSKSGAAPSMARVQAGVDKGVPMWYLPSQHTCMYKEVHVDMVMEHRHTLRHMDMQTDMCPEISPLVLCPGAYWDPQT